MLHVLIVEDNANSASSLAAMLKNQDDYLVVGFADDMESSLRVARTSNVHIAFVDVHLARLDSGYRIADELNRLGITCVFVTGTTPPFPMPELAAAWLEEPYTQENLSESLEIAASALMTQAGYAKPQRGGLFHAS